MVTDRTCTLAQGYYDLPKAITDTVASESDVQMLVRNQNLCSRRQQQPGFHETNTALARTYECCHLPCRTAAVTSPPAPQLSTPTACLRVTHRSCAVVVVHPTCREFIAVSLFQAPVRCRCDANSCLCSRRSTRWRQTPRWTPPAPSST